MRISLMIEGQEDVTWSQWVALAQAAEEAGLEGLFRSDHYGSVQGRTERGSLDAWTTLAAIGALTRRLRLGTMVSPTSFRHPSVLARSVVTVDHVTAGRVELGMGAGWNQAEHERFGFPFHDLATRFEVLEEQVAIVARQLAGEHFDHDGRHYTLRGCEARPRAVQQPSVPLIIGGLAGPRSAALAARFADEYNTVFPTIEEARIRRERIDRAAEAVGRPPLRFSVMTGCLLGADQAEVEDRAARLKERSRAPGELGAWLDGLRGAWVIGTVEQAATRLAALAAAGVDRVMLQHQLHDDLDMVGLLGQLAGSPDAAADLR